MKKMRLIGRYEDYGNREMYDKESKIYCITDDFVCREEYKKIEKEKKIALEIEPRSFIPEGYEYLERNYDEFKYVFTFDNKLLEMLPNAKRIVYGTYWCSSDEKKSKGISMISSEKSYCEGHRKRKELAGILDKQEIVDVMGNWNGSGYVEPIKAYRDYKFNIALENDKQDYYFTEKLCNCFANKVVPIYYGANKIGEYFDIRGVIIVEDRDKIPEIVANLDVDKEYEKRKEYIDKNYELVKKFRTFDDWFYNEYKEEIESMF